MPGKHTNTLLLLAVFLAILGLTMVFDHATRPTEETLSPPPATTAATRATVPDFTFTTREGKTLALKDLRGKVVILNFWASWCAPCVAEFPGLLTLTRKMEGRAVLLALSSDRSPKDIERFLAKQKKEDLTPETVLIVHDADKKITQDLFQTVKLPETILIAPDGRMIRKVVGETDWTAPALIQELKALSAAP